EPSCGVHLDDESFSEVGQVAPAARERIDLFRIDIKPQYAEARIAEHPAERQADISKADDADQGAPVPDVGFPRVAHLSGHPIRFASSSIRVGPCVSSHRCTAYAVFDTAFRCTFPLITVENPRHTPLHAASGYPVRAPYRMYPADEVQIRW